MPTTFNLWYDHRLGNLWLRGIWGRASPIRSEDSDESAEEPFVSRESRSNRDVTGVSDGMVLGFTVPRSTQPTRCQILTRPSNLG